MKKRMIALFLTLAMLVSLAPAVVADDTVPRRTVEEILNEYHEKAFEAEIAGETSAATYSPRSGSPEKTLEQETVDTLNAAGYEAYNVTAENYEALETQLKTDFADMGLDPDGSYIIAISGEESEDSSASGINPRAMVPVEPDYDPTFVHTYNGTTYTMRYLTVTCSSKPVLDRMFAFSVNQNPNGEKWSTVFDAFITSVTDRKIPISSILSLAAAIFEDNSFNAMDCNGFVLTGASTWTLEYIQVYNTSTSEWVSSQRSEYAITSAQTQFYIYNSTTQTHTPHTGEMFSFPTYSVAYYDTSLRKDFAAQYYRRGSCALDYTDDIRIEVHNPVTKDNYYISDNINNNTSTTYTFVQEHWSFYE